jgi:hypothetical protein
MPKIPPTLACLEGPDKGPDPFANARDGWLRDFAKNRLEWMKHHLDRIEVWRILRQVAQTCANCFDGFLNPKDFMGRKIVDHHNISALERRSQALLQVGEKNFSIYSSVDHHRGDYSGVAQTGDQCHRLPVSQRDISDQALSARTAAVRSHHIGADRGLVDKHQSCRVEEPLLTNPASARPSYVGALLLCRSQAFF